MGRPFGKCPSGCQCGLHKPSAGSSKCVIDCECKKHQNGRQPRTEAHKIAIGNGNRGKPKSEEGRANMRAAQQANPSYGMLGKKHSKQTKQLMREKALARPGVFFKCESPNRPESKLLTILEPFNFSFVGTGDLCIANKYPDFWDGNTKLIEMYGDYWHRSDNPQDRIDLFKAEGYDCLVIWEHELKNIPAIIKRVAVFVGVGE